MNIDGLFRYANEDQRMKELREEEAELGIQPLEFPNNALLTARLSPHPSPIQSLPGKEAHEQAAKTDAHKEHSHTSNIGESGLHELIEFASLAKVMG
jgi:hypothetical protein